MFKKVSHWLYYFVIFAFLGWIFETIVMFFVDGRFVLRGVLFHAELDSFNLFWGFPAIALYGFGGLILYYVSSRRLKIFKHPAALFLITTIVLTVLELLASYFTQIIFGKVYWRYDWGINFEGRIALVASLAWGALATLAILFLFPALENFWHKYFTKNWQSYLIVSLAVYILLCLLLRERLFPFVYSTPAALPF